MKEFVRMTLAVVCGLFIMTIIGFIMLTGLIGGLAASGNVKPVLPDSGILKLDMSRISLKEQVSPDTDPFAVLQGMEISQIGILDAISAIRSAATDPSVKFIYLKPDGFADGISKAEELRSALADFRESGKAVVSYIEHPTTVSYYLASVSDKIFMSSYAGSGSMISGVGSQMIFLKDLLDKLGVNVQLIRHGKYKSAGETFIRSTPSAENLEQTQAMVNSIWGSIASEICAARSIERADLDRMIDNLELNFPEDFLRLSLVDELLTNEQLREKMASLFVVDSFDDVEMIPFADYVAAKAPVIQSAKKKIAVIYAEGEIVEGNMRQQVAGSRFASMIAGVRADSSIKAVVLRVASPGGSVLASDKIKTEIDLLRKDKPVIASYGDFAASGGYWISGNCDKIYSNGTTLTGSIGVFSMVPDFSKTAKTLLHVGVTSVGSSKRSDMLSLTRALDDAETKYMQASVENIYSRFVRIVSEGRNLSESYVDSIAQGRVWTGAEAVNLGLADEIGTLEDALEYAILSTGEDDTEISSWAIEAYPKPMTTFESLFETIGKKFEHDNDVLAGTPFKAVGQAFRNWNFERDGHVFARMPYEYIIK